MKKIAIFPAGSEIGLEINRALQYSTHLEIYGFTSAKDHTEYVYKNVVDKIPYIGELNFIEVLNQKISENKIDYIFPANDDVQLYLTENQEKIKAKILTSAKETVRICRSKQETYNFFKEYDFTPKYFEKDLINKFPVFSKPDVGQGSKGIKIIRNQFELEERLKEKEKIIFCEYLPGEEYTVDCFTDFTGKLRVVKMRNRNRIRLGISVNSKILTLDKKVYEIAKVINEKLKFNGVWFFQLKKDEKGNYKLLEIAPRVSGTMGISRNLGINYPLLTIFNNMKIETSVLDNNFNIEVDRAFINRYFIDIKYENVYIDLDDTLIIKGKVNNFLMMFLYQCLNENKELYLISRHSKNIEETLKKYKIPKEIFKEIIHLKDIEDKKSNYIKGSSIFIDDSFKERKEVKEKRSVYVFDTSEVEGLINWKI